MRHSTLSQYSVSVIRLGYFPHRYPATKPNQPKQADSYTALYELATNILDPARVAPISDSVIGGMLTSKCAITQANRTYVLNDSLFAICCPYILNLRQQRGGFSVQTVLNDLN